ncbi:MAG: sensor histidine kinase [Clostridia bacterium]|nr:sensor histidine kinase [Clostridia bacterium]
MLIPLLSVSVLFPAAAFCFFPMKNQLKYSRRRTTVTVILTLLALSFLMSWVEYRFHIDTNLMIGPVFLLCAVLYWRCLKTSFIKSLSVFVTVVALFSVTSNISDCIAVYTTAMQKPLLSAAIHPALAVALAVLLAYPLIRYGSYLVDRMDNPIPWSVSALYGCGIFALNMLLFSIMEMARGRNSLTLFAFLAFIVLLMLFLMSYACYYFMVKSLLTWAETEKRLRLLEMRESQFDSQQNFIRASQKTRHDFRQSIRTMVELYNMGKINELGAYLKEYEDDLPSNEIRNYTDNSALNALLNYYRHICAENKIRYSVRINYPDEQEISDVDLCTIVGNILENAVLACLKTTDRYINFTILEENESQLYIVVTNSFDGKVRQSNGKYLSTNRKETAYGLSSVMSIAESYGGVAQFYHEDMRFCSNIAIPLNKKTQSKEQVL